MKQEILIQKCSQHDLETIAFDMNPSANPSCRNCCIKCLKDPFKAQYCLSLKEATIHLLNVKKTFKQRKETQILNNISILKELDKNVSELKNMYVQIFDQIKETINHQIQQYQEYNSTLESKLQSIDLDQYLSNTHDFATESLTNLGFKEKCQNLLESIFSQSSKDQFSERNIEKNSQIKKKALLSFKCKKHDEEIRLYDEDEAKIGEDKLMCDQCSVDRKGQFQTAQSQSFDSFQENIVFIQTDQANIDQYNYKIFDLLPPKIRNNFKFIAITMNTNQQLSRIVNYLKQQYFGTTLKSYYQPQFLCQTWIEALPYVL